MVKPQARSGRKVVDSDEECAATVGSPNLRTKQTTLTSHARPNAPNPQKRSTTSTPTSSPATTPKKFQAKPKRNDVRGGKDGKIVSKKIYSFFNATTERQSENSKAPENVLTGTTDDRLEVIDDWPSDCESEKTQSRKASFLQSRKRDFDTALLDEQESSLRNVRRPPQKFVKKQDDSGRPNSAGVPKTIVERDPRPWNERYTPNSFDELVVHKKKVADVRQWLEAALSGQKHRRLLVLKGAAGSGKTTTMRVMSNVLGFQIVEWLNPSISDINSANYMSVSSQLGDFLGRGRTFAALDLVTSETSGRPDHGPSKNPQTSQILMIEEFPNNISSSTEAARLFRSSILEFLAAPVIKNQPSIPLIVIITESSQSSSYTSNHRFTAHQVLGPEILHHPSTAVIEFNAVAPTFVAKALTLALNKRCREVGRYWAPPRDVLKRLSEFGDVRNAVSALEFICSNATIEGALDESNKGKLTAASAAISMSSALTSANIPSENASTLLALRESSVGLFHAVGKVVYNKRVTSEPAKDLLPGMANHEAPEHLKQHRRPLRSEIDLDMLIDDTGTDTSTFLSALHENYLSSCNASTDDSQDTLSSIQGCVEALCDADLLVNGGSLRLAIHTNTSDGSKQSELGFQVATRGILFSLPYPVKRQQLSGRGRVDAHKMFYPTALKLWKKKEEIEGVAQLLTTKAILGRLFKDVDEQRAATSRLAASRQSTAEGAFSSLTSEESGEATGKGCSLGSGNSAMHEMILERLPYAVKIMRDSDQSKSSHSNAVRMMERVTKFSGIQMQQGEDEDTEERPQFDNIPETAELAKKGLSFFGSFTRDGQHTEDLDVQRLVLSDDDIED